MRRLLALILALAGLAVGTVLGTGASRAGTTLLTVLDEINALRREHGVKPVRLEPRLVIEARSHADDMARLGYFDTRTPKGEKFESRVRGAGYPYRRIFVQLAFGYPSPLGVVAHWSSAADTRRFLVDPNFADVGLGYAARPEADGGRMNHFWVLTLAEPTRIFRGDWLGDMLRRVNAYRAAHGRAALRLDRRLNVAAQSHADDMARRDYFAHVSPEGGTAGDRARRAGYRWRRMLENLAAGQGSPREAVAGWIDSDGHRRAMLDGSVRDLGVGYAFLPADGGKVRGVLSGALARGRV